MLFCATIPSKNHLEQTRPTISVLRRMRFRSISKTTAISYSDYSSLASHRLMLITFAVEEADGGDSTSLKSSNRN